MSNEQASGGDLQNPIETRHRHGKIVGEVMEVGPARPHCATSVATHQHVPDDGIAAIQEHGDGARCMTRRVEDRRCDTKPVEPHAFGGLEVRSQRPKRKMTQQASQYAAADANALERPVVTLFGKHAVMWVIGDRALRGGSQFRRVAAMIRMHVGVQDQPDIAERGTHGSTRRGDPLGITARPRVNEHRTMIPDEHVGVRVSQSDWVNGRHRGLLWTHRSRKQFACG